MPVPSRAELAGYAVLVLLAAIAGVRYLQGQARADEPARAAVRAASDGPRPAGAAVERPDDVVVVHVAGAVREPGVYRLRRGSRVRDAIEEAGGAGRRADVHAVNLAARVEDAQQVVVPARPLVASGAGAGPGGAGAAGGDGGKAAAGGAPVDGSAGVAPGSGGPAGGAPAAGPVRLSTATLEQLDALDGVGPALARRILEARQARGGFSSVDDLAEVPGIGPKRLEALRAAVAP